MQVSIESSKGLERKLKIQLPAEQFDKALDERLKNIAKTAKLAGFRPGKVPLKVIQQKYGPSVQQEILDDLVRRSYGQAIAQEKLKPAGRPQIDAKPRQPGQDLEYVAVFEVFPEIKLGDMQKLKIEKPEVEIREDDIQRMIDKLRKQRGEWSEVQRPSRDGDQVKIDFEGSIDGKEFEGGNGQDITLVLGSKQMVEGFEEALIGISADQERTIKIKFPKNYAKTDLRGKKAQFKVRCKSVLEQKLPELDQNFIKSYGVEDGSLEALKKHLQQHMERELLDNVQIFLKRQLMDALLEMHKIGLPNILVEQEIQQLQEQALQRLGIQNGNIGSLPKELFAEEGQRRVALGLLFAEIIKQKRIQADPKAVKERVERIAAQYDSPEQVIQYYMSNKNLLRQVESLVVEDQVVTNLLDEAKVSKKNMRFDELMEANRNVA